VELLAIAGLGAEEAAVYETDLGRSWSD
jgi:hypothetical protein